MRKNTHLDSRRPSSPEALLGNQRASLDGSMLDRRLRAASLALGPVFGAVPLLGTAGGWTGNKSWKLGLRGTGMGRRRVLAGGPWQGCGWCWWPEELSPSSVTGEPRIDIDSPSENEATDERPSDAFIRWNVSATTDNDHQLLTRYAAWYTYRLLLPHNVCVSVYVYCPFVRTIESGCSPHSRLWSKLAELQHGELGRLPARQ